MLYLGISKGVWIMPLVRDMVRFSIRELKLSKIAPANEKEWQIVNNYLLDKCKESKNG
jgi:hypothetical protein